MSLAPRAPIKQQPMGPIIVFVTFTVAGCAFIVAAKLVELSALVVTGVPILLMLGYAVMAYVARGLRLRDDQIGDNLYYVGFIFTLTSLAVSLVQFAAGAGVEQIIRNFGIAVGSTITGVVLRIIFNQMRRDPVDVEVEARLELSAAARRVRVELDGILLELTHFRRTSQQMVEEGQRETAAQLKRIGDSFAAAEASLSAKASEQLTLAFGGKDDAVKTGLARFADEVAAASAQMSAVAATLSAGGTQLGDSITSLVQRLRGTRTPDEALKVDVQPVIDRLAETISRASAALEEQLAELHSTRLGIDRATEEIEQLSRRRFWLWPFR